MRRRCIGISPFAPPASPSQDPRPPASRAKPQCFERDAGGRGSWLGEAGGANGEIPMQRRLISAAFVEAIDLDYIVHTGPIFRKRAPDKLHDELRLRNDIAGMNDRRFGVGGDLSPHENYQSNLNALLAMPRVCPVPCTLRSQRALHAAPAGPSPRAATY